MIWLAKRGKGSHFLDVACCGTLLNGCDVWFVWSTCGAEVDRCKVGVITTWHGHMSPQFRVHNSQQAATLQSERQLLRVLDSHHE